MQSPSEKNIFESLREASPSPQVRQQIMAQVAAPSPSIETLLDALFRPLQLSMAIAALAVVVGLAYAQVSDLSLAGSFLIDPNLYLVPNVGDWLY